MRPVLLVLALVACSGAAGPELFSTSPPPCMAPAPTSASGIDFYPPTGFPDAERAEVDAARDTWNRELLPEFSIAWSTSSHRRILWARPPHEGFLGQYPPGWEILFVRPDTGKTEAITLHEIGHALGLHHIHVVGAVMCGRKEDDPDDHFDCQGLAPTELTDPDRAECCRVGARCNSASCPSPIESTPADLCERVRVGSCDP